MARGNPNGNGGKKGSKPQPGTKPAGGATKRALPARSVKSLNKARSPMSRGRSSGR